jgi:hypothetical protein
MNPKPNSRYSLTKKQQDILTLLYRFRFATSEQISQALSIGKATINKRLQLMTELEYIGRKYEPEYHLLRKPAAYYLLPKGIAALKGIPGNKFDASILRNISNDQTASDQFIEHSLGVFDIYCQLKAKLGDRLYFFTKSQLVNRYDYFSEFVPSVYIRVVTSGTEKDYFLEYLQSTKPFFAATQRLKEYIEYADSGEWEAETDSPFPKTLLICDKSTMQNRLLKKSTTILAEADDELKFFLATKDEGTWFDLAEPEVALSSSPI